MSTATRPDLSPEKLAEIVDEIIARRPWFGLSYLLFYPFRRFPLFLFTVLPALASRQPALLTLVLAGITLWADWRFVPRWSWDMGPQLPAFVAKICREEVIPPVLTKRDWKKIGKAALYGVPLLAAVAAAAIAGGIQLEQSGQTGGAPMIALKYLCLAIFYVIFSPVVVCMSYFWPLTSIPGTRPKREGPKYKPGGSENLNLKDAGYIVVDRQVLAVFAILVIGIFLFYFIYITNVFDLSFIDFFAISLGLFFVWTFSYSGIGTFGMWKARSIAKYHIGITKENNR